MLARVVENVYWLSRYLERAENTARIIGVNTNLLLDLPGGIAPGWLPLVDISGNRAEFDAKETKGEERDVVNFLIADKQNPGSICSSLRGRARERAHAARDPAHRSLGTAQRILRRIQQGPRRPASTSARASIS